MVRTDMHSSEARVTGPPTKFEEQVAAALWIAAADAHVGAPEIVTRLAPRVAAAIQKAAIVASSKQADAHGGNPVAHVLGYEAALVALRGESA